MRISERLNRLEAKAPAALTPESVAIYRAITTELDAYSTAKASRAVVYRGGAGGIVPIRRSQAEYHFDPDGPSLLAEWGRVSGCRLSALHAVAREPVDAPH